MNTYITVNYINYKKKQKKFILKFKILQKKYYFLKNKVNKIINGNKDEIGTIKKHSSLKTFTLVKPNNY